MKNQLPIVLQSTTYKMVIPTYVENKIRVLCNAIPNNEWSGILFYEVEGSFDDNTLRIICKDIFQMDEGISTYTEFDMSPDLCSYICDHPELSVEGVYHGLIHSHNNMAAFFSDTDTATLQLEGSDMNHFVSLIVNNAGKYTARITRKVHSSKSIKESLTYNTWGDSMIVRNLPDSIKEEDYIQMFELDLEVIRDECENEVLSRIKEIREAKKASKPNPIGYNSNYGLNYNYDQMPFDFGQKVTFNTKKDEQFKGGISKEEDLFTNNNHLDYFDNFSIPYGDFKVDKSIIDKLILQSITCSAIISNNSSVNITKWVNSMDSLFNRRFHDNHNFTAFASSFVDYLVNYTEDPDLKEVLDPAEMAAIIAYYVVIELEKLPSNKWIEILINLYKDYIL